MVFYVFFIVLLCMARFANAACDDHSFCGTCLEENDCCWDFDYDLCFSTNGTSTCNVDSCPCDTYFESSSCQNEGCEWCSCDSSPAVCVANSDSFSCTSLVCYSRSGGSTSSSLEWFLN